jgi:hypothetical protein
MMTDTTVAASKSSKSKSRCTAFCSLRFGEPDRVSEFFLAVTFSLLAVELSKHQNHVRWGSSNCTAKSGVGPRYQKRWPLGRAFVTKPSPPSCGVARESGMGRRCDTWAQKAWQQVGIASHPTFHACALGLAAPSTETCFSSYDDLSEVTR